MTSEGQKTFVEGGSLGEGVRVSPSKQGPFEKHAFPMRTSPRKGASPQKDCASKRAGSQENCGGLAKKGEWLGRRERDKIEINSSSFDLTYCPSYTNIAGICHPKFNCVGHYC